MRRSRGVTLVELLVAMALMLVAMALAGALMVAGAAIRRNAEVQSDESDSARAASNEIAGLLQLAGNGLSRGLWVVPGGVGAPVRVGAVFGADGTSMGLTRQSDDLWVVVPDKNILRESCATPGAAGMLSAADGGTDSVRAASGNLKMNCTGSFTGYTGLVVVTNLNSGALLSGTGFTPETPSNPGELSFAEQATALNDSPELGGFHQGDVVYRASIFHYFIAADGQGNPALYRSSGVLAGAQPATLTVGTDTVSVYPFPTAFPFKDDGNPLKTVLIQRGVEDLQVAYGLDTAGTGQPTTWQNGMDPTNVAVAGSSTATSSLKAVRVNIVIRDARKLNNQQGVAMTNSSYLAPISVENEYSDGGTAPSDGFRRFLYTRTIAIPNMAPKDI